MNSKNNKLDDGLPGALKTWKMEKALPQGFEEQVWRRIEAAKQPRPSFLKVWMAELVAGFRLNRAFAFSFAAACVMAGLGLGVIQAKRTSESVRSDLSLRYVQSIDPYLRHPH